MKSRIFAVTMAVGIGLLMGSVAWAQPSEPDGVFTMALTGDSIITRKLSVYQEPEFLKMIELIRDADVAFTNVEMLFHDYESYPMHASGGTYMRAEPALASIPASATNMPKRCSAGKATG